MAYNLPLPLIGQTLAEVKNVFEYHWHTANYDHRGFSWPDDSGADNPP